MTYFFTLLDDSLRPKGSRDPLGLEMLWSQVGRRLVGNLTTVSHHLVTWEASQCGQRVPSGQRSSRNIA